MSDINKIKSEQIVACVPEIAKLFGVSLAVSAEKGIVTKAQAHITLDLFCSFIDTMGRDAAKVEKMLELTEDMPSYYSEPKENLN